MFTSYITLPLLIMAWSLPPTSDIPPVYQPFFNDRLHAYIWFNWSIVPLERIAKTIGAPEKEILKIGKRMGLPDPPTISKEKFEKLHCTIIRRNWHLLPYEQIMQLLGWNADQLAYTLKEDDFLFIKLGGFKPKCEPLIFSQPTEMEIRYEEEIGKMIDSLFPQGIKCWVLQEPPLHFIDYLSATSPQSINESSTTKSTPKFCSSYFLQYGDPFQNLYESYPIEYVKKLRSIGVNGIWLQAVLYKLTPFPWDPSISEGWEKRLHNLKIFTEEISKIGVSVYLYLNEPRAMPLSFFDQYPHLKGVVEGEFASLCTSTTEVKQYLRDAIKTICERVPLLGGFFTISASENLTNCWSHHHGENCPQCAKRSPSEVIAEFHSTLLEGIELANSKCRLISWDWGWRDDWIEDIIAKLPQKVALMSVSEWDIPIIRGGIVSSIGEYSLNEPGPGPRAKRTWLLAKKYGHQTFAKLQLGTTWEIGSIPYLPVIENVARHAVNLSQLSIDGFMLGWTLGGYPSPNIEVFNTMIDNVNLSVEEGMLNTAKRRYGENLAPIMVSAWKNLTRWFREYPFHIQVVYKSPVQIGPANPLYPFRTNYSATMTGFPYDDVDNWCGAYPPNIFANQMEKVAKGFRMTADEVISQFEEIMNNIPKSKKLEDIQIYKMREYAKISPDLSIIKSASIHFQSVANQTRFILLRDEATNPNTPKEKKAEPSVQLREIIENEMELAKELYYIQLTDTRIGYESSNHYFYVPLDLVHKMLNCQKLLEEWLPTLLAN